MGKGLVRPSFSLLFLSPLVSFSKRAASGRIPVVIIITPVGLCASCAPCSSNCPPDATHTQTHEPSNGRRANYPQLPKKFEKQQVPAIQCRRHNNSRGKRYLHSFLSLVLLLFQLWNTHTPNIRWLLMDCDCFHGCQRIPAQHATFP